MERAAAKCILCDSPERSLLFRQADWSVYRCDGCGLGFLDPRPDANELAIFTGAAISKISMVMALNTDPRK